MKKLSLLVLLCSGACLGAEDPPAETDNAPAVMERREVCVDRSCDARYRACAAAQSASETACVGNCFRYGSGTGCSFCINTRACDYERCVAGSNDQCIATEVWFVRPRRDPAVQDACVAYMNRLRVCGQPFHTPQLCETWSRTERPEAVGAYRCLTALPCDASEEQRDACVAHLPASTLGDPVCDRLLALGYPCDEELRAWLNVVSQWSRPEVNNMLAACLAELDDGLFHPCVSAWQRATMSAEDNTPRLRGTRR